MILFQLDLQLGKLSLKSCKILLLAVDHIVCQAFQCCYIGLRIQFLQLCAVFPDAGYQFLGITACILNAHEKPLAVFRRLCNTFLQFRFILQCISTLFQLSFQLFFLFLKSYKFLIMAQFYP